jgi:hypothetical protein
MTKYLISPILKSRKNYFAEPVNVSVIPDLRPKNFRKSLKPAIYGLKAMFI